MKVYRLFEILPGALSWATLAGVAFSSWRFPAYTAVFIIVFDTYWLLKTIYLSAHLRISFRKMRECLKKDWQKELEMLPGRDWREIYHVVILPMYREPYELVRESLQALGRVHYPRERLIVVLATEERAPESLAIGERIAEEFGSDFFRFLVTRHPQDLPGEIPGKGSNEAWAARETKARLIDQVGIPYENIIVSVFDVDTQVFPEYFGALTHRFLTVPFRQRSSFQPVPLFTNNIFRAPALARVIAFSSTFWHMIQQSRPKRLTTFSSHAMPFKALAEVGFWNTGVVSEDSQIFWQCFFRYNGDWRTVPLFYPVAMDASVGLTFWQTMKNLYKQQRRWGWGCENIPYLLEGFLRNSSIPLRTKLYWSFHYIEGFHSWATNAIIIFSLGWLPVLLGGVEFNISVLSYNLPRITRSIMSAAMIGIASSAILSIVLLPPKPSWIRPRHYAFYVIQWLLMPFTLIVFGALPALDAQTRLMLGGKWRLGFWSTPKFRS